MAFPFGSTHAIEIKTAKYVEQVSNFFNKEMVEEAARSTGFVKRESKLTGMLFLSIFTFGMSIYDRPSLLELTGLLNLIVPSLNITREGLHQRINEKAVEFFEYMLSQAIRLRIPKNIHLNMLDGFNKVLILDSTSFQLPEELAKIFRGSGGDASNSVIKIQFCYDLKSGEFFYLIEDGIDPDNKEKNSFVNQVNEGDLIIKDLGYFNTQVFIDIDEKGGYYLMRLKSGVKLYRKDENGDLVEFNLIEFIKGSDLEYKIIEVEVFMRKGDKTTKTRLIIEKVPNMVKRQRIERIEENNKKKGRITTEETKFLQGYNLFVTNASEDKLLKQHVRVLYKIRWQIELVFKNWKSNFNLDKISGTRPERVKCMIYAKLLFIFITSNITYAARNYLWLDCKKEVSEFKASKHFKMVAQDWVRLLIKDQSAIKNLLIDAFNFIIKDCIKIKQKSRTYPLQMLDDLSW